jgi:protease IV
VVMASGDIVDGKQPPGTIGGESTSDLLRQALNDKSIRAVVLRVDSPGGSVLASEQIYRQMQALKQAGKIVVVSMSDVAASGGYYISAPADQIFASPNTITGSIGVFAAAPTFSRTLARLGVHVDGIGTTPLSGSLRLDRPMSADASRLLQATVDHDYEEFLARVAAGRGKSRDAINDIAQGRVWAGIDAQRLGLVDRLGNYEDALKYAATRAGLTKYHVRVIEPQLNWAQQLLLQTRTTAAQALARVGLDLGLGGTVSPGAVQLLQRLQPVDREIQRWQHLSPGPDKALAYCFCTVD